MVYYSTLFKKLVIAMPEKKTSFLYKIIKWAVDKCYPNYRLEGTEKIPREAVILVGNHAQLHGPLVSELRLPGDHYVWCVGEMMHLKTVPAYAYRDFWSQKPRWSRWFWKLVSYLIAPLAVCLFNNAHTVAVYRDSRILGTFKNTVKLLQEGASIVIFPEHDKPYNHIVNEFQENFVDVAKLYYKRTGRALQFVPFYLAPDLKTVYFGEAVVYDPNEPAQQRTEICRKLMERITDLACDLPKHRVVPYNNIPKKEYPENIP